MSRSKHRTHVTTISLMAPVAMLLPALVPVAAQEPRRVPSLAPLNARFLEYSASRSSSAASPDRAKRSPTDSRSLGLIPSPTTFADPEPLSQADPDVPLPSSYDLRAFGTVTLVRNQGACGNCWAFATYGALESSRVLGEVRDFSENHLKNLHGLDRSPCGGGFFNESMTYLARWQGPVDEAADPYNDGDWNSSPPGLSAQKHVQNILVFANNDPVRLKTALMTYGGVQTPMYISESSAFYRKDTASYYYDRTPQAANHYVTLIGWDDHYSRSHFATPPPNDGAFLLKNSWGASWGNGGYFWISYSDTSFARDGSIVYLTDPESNYSRIYDYDPLGWTGSIGFDSPTGSFANIFTSQADERLQAVSFYTTRANSAYTVRVYQGVTDGPAKGTPASVQSGQIELPGYHTIVLQTPVLLKFGAKFSVAVTLTTPGFHYPISVERAVANYSSRATSAAGQSYISPNGIDWQDITESDPTANVCLKAFTGAGGPSLAASVTHGGSLAQGQKNAAFQVVVSNAPEAPATNGPVTVTPTLPPGLRLVSIRGDGWVCPKGVDGCTRTDALAGGASYPPLTLVVDVALQAASPQEVHVTVAGGRAPSVTASDAVEIRPRMRRPTGRL